MSLREFEKTIENALEESIEEIRARPLNPRADLDAGRFGNPPQMAVTCYDFSTGRYTKNLRDIFPDPERAFQEAIKPR